MQKGIKQMAGYLRRNRRTRTWKKIVGVLACVVVFCTTYALILPAITMEEVPHCGKTEHTHSEACYAKADADSRGTPICTIESLNLHRHTEDCLDENGEYCCGYSDFIVHEHDEICFDESGNLWCPLPEVKAHTHDESCYARPETEPVHMHTDECYTTERGDLICTITEGEGAHTHSIELGCYDENSNLICHTEEFAGHVHTDDCFSQNKVLICELSDVPEEETDEPRLICDKPQIILHEHNEDCFDEDGNLICGKQQVLEHIHNQDCFQISEGSEDKNILICDLEEHTHTLACQSDPDADVETAADWEKTFANVEFTGVGAEDVLAIAGTQLGYVESDANFIVEKDGLTRKGYTRYGEWYGDPYGDWCAMFVSFCLNYAGIGPDTIPYEASCVNFIDKLNVSGLYADSDYIPAPGDLVFFDQDSDRLADHMGFVKEVLDDDVTEQLVTIEGNSDNCVQSVTYSLKDETILGYGKLPETSTESDLSMMPMSLFRGSVFGEPGLTPGHQKTIDALCDGEDNPDTLLDNSSDDLTDLYRLYLDVTANEKPMDLILVLDNSSSMFWNWTNSDTSLGSRNDVMNAELKKFIPAFLNSHEGNRIYLIYYSGKELDYTVGTQRFPQDQGGTGPASWDAWYKYYWGTAEQSNDVLNYLMTVNLRNEAGGSNETGRNYAAGFAKAEEALKTVNPEHDAHLVFLSAGVPSYYIKNDGTRGGNGLAVEEQSYSGWINLANTNEARCKTATLETIQNFKDRYPNLVMSAVGFGGSITTGGTAEEVLKAIPQNGGSYYHENWSNMLSTNLMDVVNVELSGVTISDTLSEYVDIHSQPDYKVTMKNSEGETVFCENGVITSVAENILQSVGYNEATRTVSAVFKPDYVLEPGATYTLSYNIQTEPKAYTDFETSGYTDMGESGTDYGTNQTSAYKMGFYANAAASLGYTTGGESHSEDYAHPVIQVKRSQGSGSTGEKITLPHNKKIDAFRDGTDNPDTTLDNNASDKTDLYRLYLDVLPLELDKPTDLVLVLDNSGSMFEYNDIDGGNRNATMNKVLKEFIPEYLATHNGNRISIVYFSGSEDRYASMDAFVEHNTTGSVDNDAWVAYGFGSDSTAAVAALTERCVNSPVNNSAGTNYVAGFHEVEDVLAQADPNHNVKMVFLSDGIPTHYIQDNGERGGNGLSSEGSASDFWHYQGIINEERCKQPTLDAISEFKKNHPDLHMSAIAYSHSASGQSSYALQAIPQNGGTISYINGTDELKDALLNRPTITNLTISDTLSQYVELYTTQPDYKVVMRKDGETDIVLFENGSVTTAGMNILEDVTYDNQTKTVSAVFKEDYELDIQWKYELSFNVQTSQAAYNEFSVSGCPHIGDKDTDYGENGTSSEQPGFHSNDSAKVECSLDGSAHSETYDHPVVQTAVCKMVIQKTDSENSNLLPNAKFSLYRKARASEQGEVLEGLEGTYVKVRENLITGKNGQILVDNLVPGEYWLVETNAPDHYIKLTSPIPIVLTHGTDGNSHIEGSNATVTIDNEALPLLNVPNNRWGHELPQTGGPGTALYTIGGLLIICAGFLLLYRKNKRRKEDFASS